ncbi:hypothetical protein ACUXV3_03870 [Roseobacteraceae bacterium NS-SX3]
MISVEKVAISGLQFDFFAQFQGLSLCELFGRMGVEHCLPSGGDMLAKLRYHRKASFQLLDCGEKPVFCCRDRRKLRLIVLSHIDLRRFLNSWLQKSAKGGNEPKVADAALVTKDRT